MVDCAGLDVAIVGGGIGGMTTALAFALRGAKVVLFEQAPAFEEVGAGLQISPNGARVLQALGVAPVGIESEAVVPMDGGTGRAIARFDLTGQEPSYRFVHRAALLKALTDAATSAGVTLQTDTRILSAEPSGRVAWAGGEAEADLVVFADGLQSVGRGLINGPAEPFFTGQVAWRAVVDHEAPPEARIWMAPGRHVVTYPLAHGRLNIVAVEERRAWAEEGWAHRDNPAHLQRAFQDCCADLRGILAKADEVNLWGLFRHKVAPVWHQGCLVLAGDAAHPTLPFLAQGANLAMEDGYALARCVGAAGALSPGLAAYQNERRERVGRAIAAANANARNYHLAGVRKFIAHNGLRAMGAVAPDAFLRRYAWIYDHDVTRPTG